MTDGNRRLKKLFRSSKTPGVIDPLPSPESTTNTAPVNQQPISSNTPISTTLPTANSITPQHPISNQAAPLLANPTGGQPLSTNSSFGSLVSNSSAPIHDMHKRRQQQLQNSVTPFPMDAGRNDAGAGGAVRGDPRRPADSRDPGWDVRPSLAEMAQMEEEAASAPYRRDGDVRYSSSRSRSGTGGSLSNLPPLENTWSGASAGGAASPIGQPAFYLPPGAGPPSPQIRPSTPPPPRMLQSNSSLTSVLPLPPQGSYVEGESYPNARARGFSSTSAVQSGGRSDHDHLSSAPVPMHAMGPGAVGRSPLGGSYPDQQPMAGQAPNAQYSWQSTPMGSDRSTPRDDSERADKTGSSTPVPVAADKGAEKEKEKKRFWNWSGKHKEKEKDRAGKESARDRDLREQREQRERQMQAQQEREAQALRDREFQAQREREAQAQAQAQREREAQHRHSEQMPLMPPAQPFTAPISRASVDESRGSHDASRETDIANGTSSAGHGDGRPVADATPSESGNDVGSAIRKLAGSRETTHGAVLDVCERVNASNSGEAVGKEAARTMRKILKSGTDAERRMTLRIWWITMRNIKVRNFHLYATNRKFIAAVEPIIMQTLKPAPSTNTVQACRDILSDLTFCHYKERGCEGLYELWKKARLPDDPEFGKQLPDDYLKHGAGGSRKAGGDASRAATAASNTAAPVRMTPAPIPPKHRSASPGSGYGHGQQQYPSGPDHHEKMRRLIEECTAAKESASVLSQTLVFTSPEELESKGLVKEFYMKCVLAHESLTSQMDWVNFEATKSRRVAQSLQTADGQTMTTVEESALALFLEAHTALQEAINQYDDLERMAADEREIRAVQERSKKDTRMDRRQQMDMLMAGDAQASSSRSPSPANRMTPLPDEDKLYERSEPKAEHVSPVHEMSHHDVINNHLSSVADDRGLSRTPSPDGLRLAQAPVPPPKGKLASPTRTESPLGRSRIPGPRPLPNPFRTVNSSQSLAREANAGEQIPHTRGPEGTDDEEMRPSRKALGKRRADPDNDFDPDDMFKTDKGDATSEHSITADDLYLESLAKPVRYAYDAWAESEMMRKGMARLSTDTAERNGVASPTNDMPAAPPKSSLRVSSNGNGERRPPAAQNVDGYPLDPVAAR